MVATRSDSASDPSDPSRTRPSPFSHYRPESTLAPIVRVTPDDAHYLHTFYDVTPFSPSQRLLAVTRVPFDDREPRLGDVAEVCVIDLMAETIRTVLRTRSWGLQLGSGAQWGRTDRYLYANDVIGRRPCGVRIDLETGERRDLSGPMVHVSPDERVVAGFPLDLINLSQHGYGAPIYPWRRVRINERRQGLWQTDLETNESTLLLSLATIREALPDRAELARAKLCLFHTKFNPQGTHVMQVVRALSQKLPGKNPQLLTFDRDGGDLHVAVPRSLWKRSGNHPNWHPDGEHLIQNLDPDGTGLRFCQVARSGGDLRVLSDRLGSGHPSVSRDGRFLLTDAKPEPPFVKANGEVPIRLIDLASDDELELCTIPTRGPGLGPLRLDPHPAWSRDQTRICFNGAHRGRRQVFIGEMAGLA